MEKDLLLTKIAQELVRQYAQKLAAEEVEKKNKDDYLKRKLVNALLGVGVPAGLLATGLLAYDKFLDLQAKQQAVEAEKEWADLKQSWSMLLNPRRWAEAAQQQRE